MIINKYFDIIKDNYQVKFFEFIVEINMTYNILSYLL